MVVVLWGNAKMDMSLRSLPVSMSVLNSKLNLTPGLKALRAGFEIISHLVIQCLTVVKKYNYQV